MTMRPISFLAALLLSTAPAFAQAPASPSPESKLREQIKTLTAQLRTAQTESATLAAEKTNLETRAKTLEADSAKLAKKMADDKVAADKETERLLGELKDKSTELATSKELHVKAEEAGKRSTERANKTEAERAKLAGQVAELKSIVSDQRMKNGKMLEISHDILKRYESFGLGTALTAREPFAGITRARLESMVDDYDGRLAAVRIRLDGTSPKPVPAKPGQNPATASAPAPAAKTANDRPSDGPSPGKKPRSSKP